MSRLITSDNALRSLLVLDQQAVGGRASEIATALGISYTGAEKALGILVADGLASVSNHRYSLVPSARARAGVRCAMAFLPVDTAIAALALGNEAVEFAGRDGDGAFVVFRRFSEPAAEGRMRDAMTEVLQLAPDATVDFLRKEDLREQLRSDLAPRRRAAAGRVLAGTVDLTFPDRTRPATDQAAPLGRLNQAVSAPSGRRLRELARRYHLRRILAFGSATRSDFRPDSDIDLLVESAAGHQLGLSERASLMADAGRLFGRDVDLLMAPVRRAALAQRISRDEVVLYDTAR